MTNQRCERVITYIDGFNLYYGLKSKKWRRYYWLDLVKLSKRLLSPAQQLVEVNYFTTRISGNPAKQQRQTTFLEALDTLPELRFHWGHYLAKPRACPRCGATHQTHEEKMTDVNIAVQLLGDAQDDRFDAALLISGDSDLTPPVQEVRRRYSSKRVVVAFPPLRHSVQLKKAANAAFTIGRRNLQDCLLPQTITKSDGFTLVRPSSWS